MRRGGRGRRTRPRRRGDPLGAEDIAILWYARTIATDTLAATAERVRGARVHQLETFSPLHDEHLRRRLPHCGMRRDNEALVRETAELETVEAQLGILLERGMQAVALLTGEYGPSRRPWAMRYVNSALKATERLGSTTCW